MTEPKSTDYKGSLTLWALVAWLLKDELRKEGDKPCKVKEEMDEQG